MYRKHFDKCITLYSYADSVIKSSPEPLQSRDQTNKICSFNDQGRIYARIVNFMTPKVGGESV